MSKVVAFSNGTEAMIWMSANCENCDRKRCRGRNELERGFVFGEIEKKIAEWIGIKDDWGVDIRLEIQCKNKDGYIQRIVHRHKKTEFKNQLKLF